jgi:hypothetical protein
MVNAMKKQLTEDQFRASIKGLDVGAQTLEIARGVLVEGRQQVSFVQALGLSRGAVSQAVQRVWAAFEANSLPDGYERVSAVLPEHQAYIVKKWAGEAAKKRDTKQ